MINLRKEIFKNDTKLIQQTVQESLERRRQAIIYTLARKFDSAFQTYSVSSEDTVCESLEWQEIESLSQLRSIVGGRFKNLKEKWIAAGLPLREHRGDREAEASVNPEGWRELSLWIAKQGYETRLAESKTSLFSLRKI